MTSINQSSGQGALFELVARGVKDTYFVKDSKSSIFPFDNFYDPSSYHLAERKTIVPLNQPKFGQTFEVEIEPYADILTEVAFEIDLPTWLPSITIQGQQLSPQRANSLYWITTPSDGLNNKYSYGYVNYIGYLLFEKIQLYQDQFLIQEWSGEGLLIKSVSEGSWNSSFLNQTISGLTIPGGRGIAYNATPGHLRIKLPLPGMQTPKDGGFPLISVQNQTFRIKATLRKLEDIVITDAPTSIKPTPWNVPQFTLIDDLGNPVNFSPLPFDQIGQPTILLSTIQHYVTPTAQADIKNMTVSIPFRKQFENIFTFGELDYRALDNNSSSFVTRRLDGRHPTEKISFFFRNQNAIITNRLDDFINYKPLSTIGGELPNIAYNFYNNMKLVIAGRDREHLLEPFVWNQINTYYKDEKNNALNIGEMKWSLGDQYGTIYPNERQPEGAVNFTTADRPTLYIELADILSSSLTLSRRSEMRVYTEGWAVYEIKEGRGRLLFAN